MQGLGYPPNVGGTWYQTATVADGDLTTIMTLQLPAAAGTPRPGPVVILWQLVVGVADAESGDSSHALVGPPQATVILPNCDDAGNCALRGSFAGPIAAALKAGDLASATNPTLAIWFDAVRTYEGGLLVQVTDPYLAAGGDSGTLSDPKTTYGALNNTPPFQMTGAAPLEILGDQLFQAAEAPYDWAAAARLALGSFIPPSSPEPVPINVWTPQRTGFRHLRLRATYDGPCPPDRVVVVGNPSSNEVAAVIVVAGGTMLNADLAVRADADWLISLRDSAGTTISTTLVPASEADAVVSGHQDCTTGKGLLDVSGLASSVPNPNITQSPIGTVSPTAAPAIDPGARLATSALVIALGLIVVVGISGSLLLRRRKT
jgi:hypothetical protein